MQYKKYNTYYISNQLTNYKYMYINKLKLYNLISNKIMPILIQLDLNDISVL